MTRLLIEQQTDSRRAILHLRVRLAHAERAAIALELPIVPLRWSGVDSHALWLAPEQWLIVSDAIAVEQLIANCESALTGMLYHVADWSDALIGFSISGPDARALLAMGSGVDFDRSVFPSGHCVRTRFAKVAAVIQALTADRFALFADRSIGHYLERWLRNACRDPTLKAVQSD